MATIEVRNLAKQYGDVAALRGVDLAVESGEVYGLVGPNGSGKTTVLDVLLDYARPTSGTATVLGYDARAESTAVRRRAGVVPEGYGVYDHLTAREHVSFVVESKGLDADPSDVLERVGLGGVADRRAGSYSPGMAKRLLLATALVGDPDVLLFDEPFGGLDPAAVSTLRNVIRAESDAGTTVLFSTHVFGAAEAVGDTFGVLIDGELVAEHDAATFRDAGTTTVGATVDDTGTGIDAVRDVPGVTAVSTDGDYLVVTCEPGSKRDVLAALYAAPVGVESVDDADPSLADAVVRHVDGRGAVA